MPETLAVYILFACIMINKLQSHMCAELVSNKAQAEIRNVVQAHCQSLLLGALSTVGVSTSP